MSLSVCDLALRASGAFIYAALAFDIRAKLLGVRLTARRKSQGSGPFAPGPGIHYLRIGCTKNNDGKRVSSSDCPAAIGGCERVKVNLSWCDPALPNVELPV